MLLTIPDSSLAHPAQKRADHSASRIGLYVFSSLILISLVYQGIVVMCFRAEQLSSPRDFQGSEFQNPYQEKEYVKKAEKIALHAHSDRVWYTPERHSPKDIEQIYRKNGYSLVTLTDYGMVKENGAKEDALTGYEWGTNLRKRHALVIGTKTAFPDLFPFYARRDNVSWTFQKIREQSGYIIIAHPKLNDSFTKQDLLEIENFQAIEVYSPFGDDTKILDTLLSKGRNVHCMASDDLHYLPESIIQKLDQPTWKNLLQTLMLQRGREGESLKRYIATASGENTQNSVKKALESGSFYCVKKHFREAEDPILPNVKINSDGLVTLESSERYLEVRWMGKNGEIKKSDPDTNVATYQFRDQDPYIRLEIIGLTGTIVSNAIVRKASPF